MESNTQLLSNLLILLTTMSGNLKSDCLLTVSLSYKFLEMIMGLSLMFLILMIYFWEVKQILALLRIQAEKMFLMKIFSEMTIKEEVHNIVKTEIHNLIKAVRQNKIIWSPTGLVMGKI